MRPAKPPALPTIRAWVGLVFVSPQRGILRYSYSLSEPRTNNEAEYEAPIAGFELAISMEIKRLHIYGDSQLILKQINDAYKINKFELALYHQYALELLKKIPEVTLTKVTRGENGKADALAKLAKEMADLQEDHVIIKVQNRHILAPALLQATKDKEIQGVLVVVDETDWREPLVSYFKEGRLPKDKSIASQVSRRILQYAFINDTLYCRSFEQMWLRCLGPDEAKIVMAEIHEGLCGAHQSGPKMKIKIKRMGYYWPSMVKDCIEHAKKCHQCQIHGDNFHRSPNPLHPTVASWPFESWGTDIIGPIDPPSSLGHRFILAATDYFSKWAEAIPLREVKADNVMKFFRDHIVYRFGVPRRIISDNGAAFKSVKIYRFIERHKIDWRYSSIYNPRANGLAEAFNKTLIKLIKKTLSKNKKEWHDKLTEALWAYRTTYKTATQATPYSLVFGTEVILPLEIEMPSLRVAIQRGLTQEENARLRLEELDALDEIRLQAQQNLENYRARMVRAHDCMVRPRSFRAGELVLVRRRPIIPHRRIGGKFDPNWEGPFIIEKVYEGGAYQLIDIDGVRPMPPINGQYIKKYYV